MEWEWRDIVREKKLYAVIFNISAIGVFALLPLFMPLSLNSLQTILTSIGAALAVTSGIYTGFLHLMEQDARLKFEEAKMGKQASCRGCVRPSILAVHHTCRSRR